MGRQAAHERRVRVYTVNDESRFVMVRNVPAIGVVAELLARMKLYGDISDYRVLPRGCSEQSNPPPHADTDGHHTCAGIHNTGPAEHDFTETLWIQYETVNNARHAKARAVQKPFYGSILHISYAPQFETVEDTRQKLTARRELLLRRARGPQHAGGDRADTPLQRERVRPGDYAYSLPQPSTYQPSHTHDENFIGPRLPTKRAAVPLHEAKPAPPTAALVVDKRKRRRI